MIHSIFFQQLHKKHCFSFDQASKIPTPREKCTNCSHSVLNSACSRRDTITSSLLLNPSWDTLYKNFHFNERGVNYQEKENERGRETKKTIF